MNERPSRTVPQVVPGADCRSQRRVRRGWLCAAVLLVALAVGAPAQAENAFAERSGQVFDLLVLRPLGVGRVVVGFVSFLPVALLAEVPVVGWKDDGYSAVADVWEVFVGGPFRATFMTPLGELDEAV